MKKIGTISVRHRIGVIFLYGISETCRQYYGCTRERVCLGFVFLGKLYGGLHVLPILEWRFYRIISDLLLRF